VIVIVRAPVGVLRVVAIWNWVVPAGGSDRVAGVKVADEDDGSPLALNASVPENVPTGVADTE
jgi:hypothetical protein